MTSLGNRATNYIVSGTSTPNAGGGDAKGYFKLYYEYEPTNLRYRISVECYLRRYPMTGNALPEISGNIRPSVNGTTGTQVSYSKSMTSGSSLSTELISTQTFSVPINISDGTSSVSFSGRFYGNLGGYTSTRTCSYTWNLPTVPIGSAITSNTSESSRIEFGSNVTFTITPPQNSNLTHTLTYNVGGTDYTIVSETSLTTIPYAFPTSLINNFIDTSQPSIVVNCLNSEGNTTSTTVYLQVPDTDTYRPTVSISLADVMQNKPQALDGLWIKNKSLLQGTITATPKNGTSINSYQARISDFDLTYTDNPFTTQALTISGSRTITYGATDKRGLTKTSTQNISVIDYETPSISSAKVERCLQDGTLNETGSYGKVTVSYKVFSISNNNVEKNTVALTVRKDSGNDETITTSLLEGTVTQIIDFSLTETTTAIFTFTLTDIFNNPVTYEFTLGIAIMTVSKRVGGKGIAFGKVATQDGFDCNFEATFRKDIYCSNGKLGTIITHDEDELPTYSTDTFTCTKTSGGATITSSTYEKYGKVITIYIVFTVQTATSAGNNAWEGTITDLPLPNGVVTASAFIGNQPYSLNIDENGNMIIRALTTTLAVNSNDHNISATYVTNN